MISTTEVESAERDVADSKQRLQQSLRTAGETGTRLAREVRQQVTPALVTAVVVGVVVVAGVAIAAGRRRSSASWRAPHPPSWLSELARAAGARVLRIVALRVAAEVATRLRAAELPSSDTAHTAP